MFKFCLSSSFFSSPFSSPFLVALSLSKQSSESATSTSSLATSLLGSRGSIASLSTEDILRVGTGIVVHNGSTGHTAPGRNIVVGLSSLVCVLGHGIGIGRVDDHDHALLAMLRLRAVDVNGLVIGDRDHEHGRVAGLTVLVPARGAVGASLRVARNRLEVREEGVLLGLARPVGSGRGNRVVLMQVSDVAL
jgi:hypothetical protein